MCLRGNRRHVAPPFAVDTDKQRLVPNPDHRATHAAASRRDPLETDRRANGDPFRSMRTAWRHVTCHRAATPGIRTVRRATILPPTTLDTSQTPSSSYARFRYGMTSINSVDRPGAAARRNLQTRQLVTPKAGDPLFVQQQHRFRPPEAVAQRQTHSSSPRPPTQTARPETPGRAAPGQARMRRTPSWITSSPPGSPPI